MEVMRYELGKEGISCSGVEVITSLIAIVAILKQLAASSVSFKNGCVSVGWYCG